MTLIPFESGTTTLNGGDLLPIYVSNQGDVRRTSLTNLLGFMQLNLSFNPEYAQSQYITCYSAPSSTGFSVSLPTSASGAEDGDSLWLILTPTGTLSAGTIVLPESTTLVDKQQILVNCTQIVTTLTVSGNGATVTGAPTTLAANGYFKLQYDQATNVWYRVG